MFANGVIPAKCFYNPISLRELNGAKNVYVKNCSIQATKTFDFSPSLRQVPTCKWIHLHSPFWCLSRCEAHSGNRPMTPKPYPINTSSFLLLLLFYKMPLGVWQRKHWWQRDLGFDQDCFAWCFSSGHCGKFSLPTDWQLFVILIKNHHMER